MLDVDKYGSSVSLPGFAKEKNRSLTTLSCAADARRDENVRRVAIRRSDASIAKSSVKAKRSKIHVEIKYKNLFLIYF